MQQQPTRWWWSWRCSRWCSWYYSSNCEKRRRSGWKLDSFGSSLLDCCLYSFRLPFVFLKGGQLLHNWVIHIISKWFLTSQLYESPKSKRIWIMGCKINWVYMIDLQALFLILLPLFVYLLSALNYNMKEVLNLLLWELNKKLQNHSWRKCIKERVDAWSYL